MKLIVKKIPAILISFFLTTNAYGNAALREILKSPRGPQVLGKIAGVSPKEIAALPMRRQVSLYRTETARSRSVFEDLNLPSSGANVEEIGEALALAVFIGNVPLYREQMIKLLHVSLPELNSMKEKGIISEKILKMMHKHPIESVRHQFRRELYDLVNHLHKVERPESPSPLLELPEGHVSLFEAHIPKRVLEETPLGRAIINNNPQEFIEVYNNLLKNGSVKELLAQAYAKSSSGKGLRSFVFERMDFNNVTSLLNAGVASNTILTSELRRGINKFNYKESDIMGLGAALGLFSAVTATIMMVPLPEHQAYQGALVLVTGFAGIMAGMSGTEKILETALKAR